MTNKIQFPIHESYQLPLIKVIKEWNATITFDKWESLEHLNEQFKEFKRRLGSVQGTVKKPVSIQKTRITKDLVDIDDVVCIDELFQVADDITQIKNRVESGEIKSSDLIFENGVLKVWEELKINRCHLNSGQVDNHYKRWLKEQRDITKEAVAIEAELKELARLKDKYEVKGE